MAVNVPPQAQNAIQQRFQTLWHSSALFQIIQRVLDQPRDCLGLRLTLLLLIFYGSSDLTLDVPLRVICGLMLMIPELITHSGLWVIICGCIWWMNAANWLWIDNHQFLISYWCLVCTLGISSKNRDAVLAWNGRLLVGLVFLFATIWKLLAGEYWTGSFLHYTFLTDDRIAAFATMIGGLSPDVLPQNQLLESVLKTYPQAGLSVTLGTSPWLQRFTIAASYWTLLIEGTVALAFLGVGWWGLARFRNWLLLIFIATTYVLLPVLGFASILIIMGLAQCSQEQRRDRLAYLLLLGGLQLTRLI